MAAIAGVVALGTAVTGALAGVASYGLYTIDVISADAGATLILVSVLAAIAAMLIGLVAWRLAMRRGRDPTVALSGLWVGLGTLGGWLIVVTVSLGK